jgi:hypothetical protein
MFPTTQSAIQYDVEPVKHFDTSMVTEVAQINMKGHFRFMWSEKGQIH